MPEITPYADNSAEAMLRVISLFIIGDGEVKDEEMEMLEELGVFERFGVDRDDFARIFDGYCDDSSLMRVRRASSGSPTRIGSTPSWRRSRTASRVGTWLGCSCCWRARTAFSPTPSS